MSNNSLTHKASRYFSSKALIKVTRDASLLTGIFVFLIASNASFALSEFFGFKLPLAGSYLILFIVAMVLTVTIRSFIRSFFDYLEVDEPITSKEVNIELKLDEHLEKFKNELVTVTQSNHDGELVRLDISQDTKTELIASLVTTIKQQLNDGAFSLIDKEFVKRDLKYRQWEGLITDFNAIKDRLGLEAKRLQQRAKLNLAFGTFITVIAGIGLLYMVFFRPLDLAGLAKEEYGWRIASHYIPRLSLIIFAEIFAYFFLKLYKADLSDIKYYQNEITNVEMKLAALRTALAVEQKELDKEGKEIIKTVITSLVGTERNFILKKGETTIELEKAKFDGAGTRDLAGHLAGILKAKS